MSRNGLYLLVGVLAVVAIVLGFYVWQEQQKPALQVTVDGKGISVEGKG